MLVGYVAVTVVAAAACASAAVLNLTRNRAIAETAERLSVPTSWQVPLGLLLAAGSLGLVGGLALPALGTAAACGLVLYFMVAAGAHIRARDTQFRAWANWAGFFGLSMAALVTGMAHHGAW